MLGSLGGSGEITIGRIQKTWKRHVTLWRARCRETCTAGSEGGVGKHSSAVRLAPTLREIGKPHANILTAFGY